MVKRLLRRPSINVAMDSPGPPREGGTSLVEFALLTPILVTLLVGILEFGRVLDAWLVVANAAREGARNAALGLSAAQVRDEAYNYLARGVGTRTDVQLPSPSEIEVIGAGGRPGDPVSVRVPLRVWIYTPLVQSLLPANPVPLYGSVTMRLQ